jgi:hypothetical protein
MLPTKQLSSLMQRSDSPPQCSILLLREQKLVSAKAEEEQPPDSAHEARADSAREQLSAQAGSDRAHRGTAGQP